MANVHATQPPFTAEILPQVLNDDEHYIAYPKSFGFQGAAEDANEFEKFCSAQRFVERSVESNPELAKATAILLSRAYALGALEGQPSSPPRPCPVSSKGSDMMNTGFYVHNRNSGVKTGPSANLDTAQTEAYATHVTLKNVGGNFILVHEVVDGVIVRSWEIDEDDQIWITNPDFKGMLLTEA